MRVRTILSVSALDTTYATYMKHMSHYPETYLKQWPQADQTAGYVS